MAMRVFSAEVINAIQVKFAMPSRVVLLQNNVLALNAALKGWTPILNNAW
jgi:hypothetical protein